MSMHVLITKTAQKDIGKLPSNVRARIKAKLQFFSAQQRPLEFAKALKKPADAQYRFRLGNYRVLFDVEDDVIIILRVQHRREVYR